MDVTVKTRPLSVWSFTGGLGMQFPLEKSFLDEYKRLYTFNLGAGYYIAPGHQLMMGIHYLATGLINGHKVEFLIDTGATHVALPASVANKLGLRKGIPSTSHTAGGVVQTWLVELDSVQLGPIRRHAVRASVVPDMPGEGVLLGMSFLRDLEMVQRGDTLVIRP